MTIKPFYFTFIFNFPTHSKRLIIPKKNMVQNYKFISSQYNDSHNSDYKTIIILYNY